MTPEGVYILIIGVLIVALAVLAGLLWVQSRDQERAADREVALHDRVTELHRQETTLRQYLAAGAARERELRERCKQYLDELDALAVAGPPNPREAFAASVEADLAALEVAEPERPTKPRHAIRFWTPATSGYDPVKPPFGMAIYPERGEGQR